MDFITAIKAVFGKYVTFSGRAQRSEFWWFVLFYFAASIALSIVDSTLFGTVTTAPGSFEASTNTPILSGLFMLGTFLPYLAVSVRRLHDTDRSGWWILIGLVPIIGFILLIVWYASKGSAGKNRFGNDPLGGRGFDDGDDYSRSSVPGVSND